MTKGSPEEGQTEDEDVDVAKQACVLVCGPQEERHEEDRPAPW